MRWKTPTKGSERVIKRFAILPIEAGKETRWLEVCYIKQSWYQPLYVNVDGFWKNIAFVTEEDYDEFHDNLYNL